MAKDMRQYASRHTAMNGHFCPIATAGAGVVLARQQEYLQGHGNHMMPAPTKLQPSSNATSKYFFQFHPSCFSKTFF
ncbi:MULTISPECIES: hypothetical protein [unclassified Herbaspirillum]|uniref:hypothetical protein n=1 Tax=unclassified Herbaspirillum TaxID=2624150 RepID=UPI001153D5D2|nr:MULTISPECIES: hypothetical protein [unclassified Herbaspirillum]MBB5391514.1 FAD/FMN-containing dehydrogenase [Herbaspirillum sp. SJZ102]